MPEPTAINFDDLTHYNEKQKLAKKALEKNKYILYGGAVGGGKSYWLRWTLIELLMYYFGTTQMRGIVVGLFCEDYPALKDRHISKMVFEIPQWLGRVKDDATYGLCFMLNPKYGSGVIALRNLDDPSKYASSEFAAIAVDEITKNPKEVFDFLRMRLRWPGIDETRFIAGTNPGGIGHAWVKKIWMDKDFDKNEKEGHLFAYIPATAYDNPALPPSYFAQLEGLPDEKRRAFLEGNWDLFEGQYFSEWRESLHVIEPFIIPPHWRKFRAYDHGRSAYACCKWYALDENGALYAYRELYVKDLDVDEIAPKILSMSGDEDYEFSVADPAIFAHLGYRDRAGGQTIAETFARHGIIFLPASNRRVDGWNLMHQYLRAVPATGDQPARPPLLRYFSNCKDSTRTIPTLIFDKTRVEDLDTKGEDHPADTDRYMLMALHEQRADKAKTPEERRFEKMRERYAVAAKNLNDVYYPH